MNIHDNIHALTATYDGYHMENSLPETRPTEMLSGEPFIAEWLDRVGIRWEYEPHLFRFASGRGFQPDFYLPDLGMYIEAGGKNCMTKFIKVARTHARWHTPIVVMRYSASKRLSYDPFFFTMTHDEAVTYLREKWESQRESNITLQLVLADKDRRMAECYPRLAA